MNLEQCITIFAIVAANIGTVLALYFQTDKKLDDYRRDTQNILTAIQSEMKDFHGRLCAIEERAKNVKIEKEIKGK